MPSREETTAASANHLPIKGTRSRNRWFADSLLEGDGFELPVPRAMQARLEAKIAGFGCVRRRLSAAAVGGHQLRRKAKSRNRTLIARGTGSSNPSPSSRQSVSHGISPLCIEKPAVAAACAGSAGRHGRQRRVGLVNITPTAGNISVGPYSSTAAPARRSRRGCTGVPSEVGLAI